MMIVNKTSVPRPNDLQLRKLIAFLQSITYLLVTMLLFQIIAYIVLLKIKIFGAM